MNYPRIRLKRGREIALRRGHPWIFSGALARVEGGIEPGAVGHFEWRDYAGGAYRVGPSVRIDGDGKLLSGGKLLGKVPLSRWLRIEITCGLGETADGKWMLRYGPSGGELAQVELTCDPQFRKLDWAGFIADATVAAAFYVDNVKIGPSPVP